VCRQPRWPEIVTGSYNNNFILHNTEDKSSLTIEALRDPPRLQRPAAGATTGPAAAAPAGPHAAPPAANNKARQAKDKAKDDKANKKNAKKDKEKERGAKNDKKGEKAPDDGTPNVNLMDFGKKALHVAWHPHRDAVAVAGLNKIYLYQMT